MTTIAISENCRLNYTDEGSGDVVVLLHAFPFSESMWEPQRAALRDEFRVLTPNLRGFGGSDPFTETPSVEQMADDVAQFLTALSITEPVVVGGLSMGGYVALAFARRYPDRLRGLILADTRAESDTEEARAARNQLIEFAQSRSARDVIEKMMPKLVSPLTVERQPELLDCVRGLAAAEPSSAVVDALLALRERPDATPYLQQIAVPTLVIVGAEDAITPPAAAATLTMHIDRASKVMIEGAGHLSNLEQPRLFNAAVQAFLRNLP